VRLFFYVACCFKRQPQAEKMYPYAGTNKTYKTYMGSHTIRTGTDTNGLFRTDWQLTSCCKLPLFLSPSLAGNLLITAEYPPFPLDTIRNKCYIIYMLISYHKYRKEIIDDLRSLKDKNFFQSQHLADFAADTG
jgi:hypothetical protein